MTQLYNKYKLRSRFIHYISTGANWFNNIVGMLKSGNTDYKVMTLMDYWDLDVIEQLPAPRVYCSHLQYQLLPPAIKKDKIKIINLLRNPKDCVVSYYKFLTSMDLTDYTGNFNGFLNYFLDDKCNYLFNISCM